MINAQEFVRMFAKEKQIKYIKFGEVVDATGRPQIKIDGESTASIKRYPYLASYEPLLNDRVMIVHGVVIGKII